MIVTWLYRIAAVLLLLGATGHTLGGMLGTARHGPQAGQEADRVLVEMRSVHFVWRGMDSSWYRWWLGNGLCVSALLILAIVILWMLGDPRLRQATLPIAWAAFVSLSLLGFLGFKYFGTRIGAGFSAVALLTDIAVILSTVDFLARRTS
jgi:hypothetical protein